MTPELPKSVTLDDRGHEIEIVWRWFTGPWRTFIFLAVFWSAMVLLSLSVFWGPFSLLSLLFVPGILGLLFLGRQGLKQLLNSTTVTVSGEKIDVSSGPIDASTDAVIDPLNVHQLYSLRKEITNSSLGLPGYVYEIHAIVSDLRDDVLIVGNIENLDQTLFIEGEIERYLEITDQEVPGSLSRKTGQPVPPPASLLTSEVEPEKPGLQHGSAEISDAVTSTPREWQGDIIDPEQNPIINPDPR